jgi:mediator of RNA polymerase II transcription subunit 23
MIIVSFQEFPNPAAHVLHSTCVELMALPVVPTVVASAILEVVNQGRAVLDASESGAVIESWFNATGLILVSLPDPYWLVLHDRLIATVEKLSQPWIHTYSPLRLFDFKSVHESYLYSEYASLLGITHALWHHLGTGHIHHILL